MKKISPTIARAFAIEAKNKISSVKSTEIERRKKSILNSSDMKKFRTLKRKADQANEQYERLRSAIEKFYGVTLSIYSSGKIEITIRRSEIPSVDALKTEMIIANQVHDVPAEKVLEHVINKFLKK